MSDKTKRRGKDIDTARENQEFRMNVGKYASVPRVKGKPKEGLIEMYKKARPTSKREN